MNDSHIPGAVQTLAKSLGVTDTQTIRMVRFSQSGRMRQDGNSRWQNFTATQRIWVGRCAFDWRARTGPMRMITIRDALIDGVGRLDVRMFGFLPVKSFTGSPQVTRGELMRYLAELPWVPFAILRNESLQWRQDADDKLIVSARLGTTAAEVRFTLDTNGRIVQTFAPDRPRSIGNDFILTPWIGRYSRYQQKDGIWLPRTAEVSWIVDGAEEQCFDSEIYEWDAIST